MKYFSKKETSCQCGCGGEIKEELGIFLDALRQSLGRPLIITSGYRCKARNEQVGGVSTSLHTKGEAVDIRVNSRNDSYEIAKKAMQIGFTGIGVNNKKGFIHLSLSTDIIEGLFPYT